jgi:hypothetical protein
MPKIAPAEFILKAIDVGKTGKSKGLHTASSGLEIAFHTYFGEKRRMDTVLKTMEKSGQVVVVPVKGGQKVYKPEDAPAPTPAQRSDTLLRLMELKVPKARTIKSN